MRATLVVSAVVVAALIMACSSSSTSVANSCGSSGASANVNTTSSNTFSPQATTITHGQSVCWQNSSAVPHTVTDNGGAFDTNLPVGQIFVHTYAVAGTYPYHCKIHAGMTGTITVN
ncbi:MAG TPA: cupredoxin domain-containing protein [Gemmatimonadales bacterium]|nr:cupredoxin domain-containing protein [Gemmatimonadales bacterium]